MRSSAEPASELEENAAAAAEMRSTTDHVTNAMVPVAATAAQNAATAQEAARSTQQLALGIADIDTAAQALRVQAEQLEGLVGKFVIDESGRAPSVFEKLGRATVDAGRKRVTPKAVSLQR